MAWDGTANLKEDQMLLPVVHDSERCGCMTCSAEAFDRALESDEEVEYEPQWVTLIDLTEGFCGTACCVAGHAVVRAGYRVGTDQEVYDHDNKYIGDIESVARRLLDLDEIQAMTVFAGGTSDVKVLKHRITQTTGITFDE
jgi:hypothetical protein